RWFRVSFAAEQAFPSLAAEGHCSLSGPLLASSWNTLRPCCGIIVQQPVRQRRNAPPSCGVGGLSYAASTRHERAESTHGLDVPMRDLERDDARRLLPLPQERGEPANPLGPRAFEKGR